MIINTKTENPEQSPAPGTEQWEYWARRGSKTGAFLLIIPGSAIVGLGIGLLLNQVIPDTVIGAGAGLVLWGLIVALTD